MTKPVEKQLKLRIFAGPNGSGKSTVIDYVRAYRVNGKPIDFGYYVNADEIAVALRDKGFHFGKFDITVSRRDFSAAALLSGLLNKEFPEQRFRDSYTFGDNGIQATDPAAVDRLAQVIADYLRYRLLSEHQRFSFETVFSHQSKLDIMKAAVASGYKVYLYFVSTESWEINAFRVMARKAKGGHDVPADKIESRYYRSLGLLYEAAQVAYQVYFFDNSAENTTYKLFAHFRKVADKKEWDEVNDDNVPNWFRKYYKPQKKGDRSGFGY